MHNPEIQRSGKQTIVELQEQIRQWEFGSFPEATGVCSTGCDALDQLFPGRGVRRGTLVEWLGEGLASGAVTLSLLVGRQVCQAGRPVIAIDRHHHLFPLSMELLGFDLARVVMIRPTSERDALWACEEALRCEGVGLVWANIERLSSTCFRRLQLAVEATQGIGFLSRSAGVLPQPSWADARLLIRPRPSHQAAPCLQVEVTYSRGKPRRSVAEIRLDRFRGTIHEISNPNSASPLPVVS